MLDCKSRKILLRTELRGLSMTLKTSDDIDHLGRPLNAIDEQAFANSCSKRPPPKNLQMLAHQKHSRACRGINIITIFKSHAEAVLLRTSVRISLWILPRVKFLKCVLLNVSLSLIIHHRQLDWALLIKINSCL